MTEKTAVITAETLESIDLSAQPFNPNNWEVTNHDTKLGPIQWDLSRVRLHLSESQKENRSVKGHYLEFEVKYLNVLNANVLQFFQKNPDAIPQSFWPTGDAISQSNVFWGTRYKNSSGKRFVCCLLCFRDKTAQVSYSPIDHGFSGSDPAVIWE